MSTLKDAQLGDTVTMSFVVVGINAETRALKTEQGFCRYENNNLPCIITPKPWEPKVGDIVTKPNASFTYEILAIANDKAWIKNCSANLGDWGFLAHLKDFVKCAD